ncbi:MAG: cation transporter [Bacteroidetes bacterium]|nr:cation transporter [Bacteroidota bacterium]
MKTQTSKLFKTLMLLTAVLFMFAVQAEANAFTHNHNETEAEFKVLGKCGMCTTRIEKAAKGVKGVTYASYDLEKQMLKVKFKSDKTNQEAIEKAITNVGHDTENFKTDDKTYNNLHHCCKYKRD